MANVMTIHCGGQLAELEDLGKVALPEKTDSYIPVHHQELAEMIKNSATELLRQPLKSESYALARDGQRMFGMQVYGEDRKCETCKGYGTVDESLAAVLTSHECPNCKGTGWEPDEFGLAVAFRNSYDKSMSIGIALGFNVFLCDNLAINGEVRMIRKHTKNVWEQVDKELVHTLYRKRPEMEIRFREDVSLYKSTTLGIKEGYEFLGLCAGVKVLSPTQMSVALNEWRKVGPDDQFGTCWQLYNAVTFALKSTPVHRVLEAHQQLHQLMGANM